MEPVAPLPFPTLSKGKPGPFGPGSCTGAEYRPISIGPGEPDGVLGAVAAHEATLLGDGRVEGNVAGGELGFFLPLGFAVVAAAPTGQHPSRRLAPLGGSGDVFLQVFQGFQIQKGVAIADVDGQPDEVYHDMLFQSC